MHALIKIFSWPPKIHFFDENFFGRIKVDFMGPKKKCSKKIDFWGSGKKIGDFSLYRLMYTQKFEKYCFLTPKNCFFGWIFFWHHQIGYLSHKKNLVGLVDFSGLLKFCNFFLHYNPTIPRKMQNFKSPQKSTSPTKFFLWLK